MEYTARVNRRELLKIAGAALAGSTAQASPRAPKKVIVMGAGIAGLSCGYDHLGAEHFYYPGYNTYWKYM